MEKVDLTYGNTLRIWWAFMWRAVLFSTILGFVLGFIGAFTIGPFVEPETGRKIVAPILGYLGSIPVSIWVLNEILSKKYKTFSVALIREGSD